MGMFWEEGLAGAKLPKWRDLEVYRAQQGDQTGLEHRMRRRGMRRLDKQGPDCGGPGGPGRHPEVPLSTVGSKGRVFGRRGDML